MQRRWQQQCLQRLAGAEVGFEEELILVCSRIYFFMFWWSFVGIGTSFKKVMLLLIKTYSTSLRKSNENQGKEET